MERVPQTPTDFNSRPSARGDVYANALMAFDIEFQFTPLREGRHTSAE